MMREIAAARSRPGRLLAVAQLNPWLRASPAGPDQQRCGIHASFESLPRTRREAASDRVCSEASKVVAAGVCRSAGDPAWAKPMPTISTSHSAAPIRTPARIRRAALRSSGWQCSSVVVIRLPCSGNVESHGWLVVVASVLVDASFPPPHVALVSRSARHVTFEMNGGRRIASPKKAPGCSSSPARQAERIQEEGGGPFGGRR